MHLPNKQSAFSLVELSIVLVILGLLVGGILAGQSLIRASELRTITSEAGRYVAATNAFRDKYLGLPGDLRNATDFWTSRGGNGSDATCQALANNGTTATCNGDGDGTFGINFGSVNPQYEQYRFWQHLANAGLVEGTFTGTPGGGFSVNSNVPASKSGSSNFWVAFSGHSYGGATTTAYGGSVTEYAGDYGKNGLQIRRVGNSFTTADSFSITPEEAWNVDTKMDDGMPGTGKIIANKGNATNTNCTTVAGAAVSSADATSTYKLDNKARDCWFFFRGVL